MSLPLQHHGGDQALHLRGRELLLLAVLARGKGENQEQRCLPEQGKKLKSGAKELYLQRKGPLDDVLADVVLLGQVKQLPESF